MRLQHLGALIPSLGAVFAATQEHFDVLNYVDPLIGTTNGGQYGRSVCRFCAID